MIYITNTFSPLMLKDKENNNFKGKEYSLEEIQDYIESLYEDGNPEDIVSAISHEVTVPLINTLLDLQLKFNRVSLALEPNDVVLCIIPKFRAEKAREFTKEEVEQAGVRCFKIVIVASKIYVNFI